MEFKSNNREAADQELKKAAATYLGQPAFIEINHRGGVVLLDIAPRRRPCGFWVPDFNFSRPT
jgi:hypothetical protein